jgi:hypothetical protein
MNEHRSALEDLSAALIVCPNNTQTRKALCRLGVETTDTMQASLNRFTTIEKRLTHAAQLAGMQPIPNNFPECVSGGGGQRRLHGSATARTRMKTARDESTPFTVRVATSSAATAKVRRASESSSLSTRSRRRRLRKQAPAREPARDGRAQQQWSRGVATLHTRGTTGGGGGMGSQLSLPDINMGSTSGMAMVPAQTQGQTNQQQIYGMRDNTHQSAGDDEYQLAKKRLLEDIFGAPPSIVERDKPFKAADGVSFETRQELEGERLFRRVLDSFRLVYDSFSTHSGPILRLTFRQHVRRSIRGGEPAIRLRRVPEALRGRTRAQEAFPEGSQAGRFPHGGSESGARSRHRRSGMARPGPCKDTLQSSRCLCLCCAGLL